MSWSDLPSDLLSEIANRIHDRFHILDFRAVCRSWRAAVVFPKFPNYALLSPILPYKLLCSKYANWTRNYIASNVYLIEPRGQGEPKTCPKFWLARIDEIAPGRVALSHPLSGSPIHFQNTMSLLNLRFVEVHKSIKVISGWCRYDCFKRVLAFENWDQGRLDGITFAGLMSGILFVYNTRDPELCRSHGIMLEDIVSYKGMIFGVIANGKGYVVDPRGLLDVSEIVSRLPQGNDGKKRLVESNGNVYLVVMYKRLCDLKVYKLDENKRQWVKINGLDDLDLFIASDYSFALSSKQCAGFQGNCVYVLKNAFQVNEGRSAATIGNEDWHRQIGIFRFNSQTTIENENSYDFSLPPPIWLYTS